MVTGIRFARGLSDSFLCSLQHGRFHGLLEAADRWETPGAEDRLAPLFATFIVDTRKTTAAALVWLHALRRAPEAQRWLRALSEKGSSADETIRQDWWVLLALMQPHHWCRSAGVLASLATPGSPAEEREQLARWYVEEHLPQERALAEGAEVLRTSTGLRVGWVDLRGLQGHFYVTQHVIRQHGVDLVATVLDKEILLGSGSIDQGPDLSCFHGEHERNGVRFIIVGHRSPVAIRPREGVVSDTFLSAARDALAEAL